MLCWFLSILIGWKIWTAFQNAKNEHNIKLCLKYFIGLFPASWFRFKSNSILSHLGQDIAVEPDFFQDWTILQSHRVQGVQLVVVDGQKTEDGESGQGLMMDCLEVIEGQDEAVEVVQRDEGVRRDRVEL